MTREGKQMKRETCKVEIRVDIRDLAKIISYLQAQGYLPKAEGCISIDTFPTSGEFMKIPKGKIISKCIRILAKIISKEDWTIEKTYQILVRLSCDTNGFEVLRIRVIKMEKEKEQKL